ncbi:dihydrofolate reductase [Gracilibacillus alcaliphilus]|uniref:dihydrofolate reductase n=1 Tax=Gracilibacillus alcaliphilus TaxID=1401441 RepID=UPI00195E5696|nr:dihydrofolate reductase [Gracilibacillus alcaliphilus]MBM7675253.1 dihydrofolate reductase [Gracilibacillus alcaliphilus]
MISLLFAMSANRVIGKDQQLPWHLPKDLKFFKEKTTGQTIIMGRKTFESMNAPLPNRHNVLLTSKEIENPEGYQVIHSMKDIQAMEAGDPDTEWFVIGGEGVFREALTFADRIYMTYIDKTFEGDTFFPEFDESKWEITSRVKGERDEKNPYDYYFIQYDRKKS